MAKVGGNYINSVLIKTEAISNGFTEGIALDAFGYISEGSGENIFFGAWWKSVHPSRQQRDFTRYHTEQRHDPGPRSGLRNRRTEHTS